MWMESCWPRREAVCKISTHLRRTSAPSVKGRENSSGGAHLFPLVSQTESDHPLAPAGHSCTCKGILDSFRPLKNAQPPTSFRNTAQRSITVTNASISHLMRSRRDLSGCGVDCLVVVSVLLVLSGSEIPPNVEDCPSDGFLAVTLESETCHNVDDGDCQ